MSTPVQSVPGIYNQQVQIGGGAGNPDVIRDAQRDINRINRQVSALNRQTTNIRKQLQTSKKMPEKQRRRLQGNLEKLRAQADKMRAERNNRQETLYVHSGQYEKLLSGTQRDAFSALRSMFAGMGLGSLAGKIFDYVKNGYSADTITVLLQDTKEYKERFKGNEARQAAGLPVLSPAEYLSVEASYQQIMQSAGMPTGFYDNPADFRQWIGKNISPSEIQERVDLATQAVQLSNPEFRQALNKMGIKDSELTAYFLDSKRALPKLQESAAIAATGSEAIRQGLTFNAAYTERLVQQGISQEEAAQGYSIIAQELGTLEALGSMYGMGYGQRTAEQAVLEQKGSALQKRQSLIEREQAEFGGAVGGARGGFAQAGGAR